MPSAMDVFKIIIIVQVFYSVAITGMVYVIPDESLSYVTGFSDITDQIDINTVSEDIQESLNRQTSLPVVEMGALIFYSGNIIIDLLMNFFFAIPDMFIMLLNGITMIFNIDVVLMGLIQLFVTVVIIVMYFISILELVMNVRSGRVT